MIKGQIKNKTASLGLVQTPHQNHSHNGLFDRDLENQHPIKAIKGLQEELKKIKKLEAEIVDIKRNYVSEDHLSFKIKEVFCLIDNLKIDLINQNDELKCEVNNLNEKLGYHSDELALLRNELSIIENNLSIILGNINNLSSNLANKADLIEGKVPEDQLPKSTTIVEAVSVASFPREGQLEKLYIDTTFNSIYR